MRSSAGVRGQEAGAAADRCSPQSAIRNPQSASGVRLLYISPLKALNNDIERNLRAPLAGIRATAAQMGIELPPLRVAVRTGDTPGSARMAMVKQPPHILITTPESLYLMLTSPRAREMLRTVRTVIVDEIHTLVGNKRGVHLSLSLERLEHLAGHTHPAHRPVRHPQAAGRSGALPGRAGMANGRMGAREHGRRPTLPLSHSPAPPLPLVPRPVTIVDTGYRKPLDLQVVTPVDDFRSLPGETSGRR